MSGRPDATAVAVRRHIGDPSRPVNTDLYPVLGEGLVVEIEQVGPRVDFPASVESALQMALASSSVQVLRDESARLFESHTGWEGTARPCPAADIPSGPAYRSSWRNSASNSLMKQR